MMLSALSALIILAAFVTCTHAGGVYPSARLHSWFDKLASGKGPCCSFADGRSVSDVEWGTNAGHYWVIVDGQRLVVPDDAVVTEPNKYGPSVVWPYTDASGVERIRCFLPGAGA